MGKKKKPKTGWGSRVHVRYPSRGDGVTGGGGAYTHTQKGKGKEDEFRRRLGGRREGSLFFCHVQLPVADE